MSGARYSTQTLLVAGVSLLGLLLLGMLIISGLAAVYLAHSFAVTQTTIAVTEATAEPPVPEVSEIPPVVEKPAEPLVPLPPADEDGSGGIRFPAPPEDLAERIVAPSDHHLVIGTPGHLIRRLFFVSFKDSAAIAVYARTDNVTRVRLEIFALNGAQLLGGLEFDAPQSDAVQMDLSPDGSLFAIENPTDKISVYSVADGKKVVTDFALPKVNRLPLAERLSALAFVSKDRLATINGTGRVEVWQVPTMKSVVSGPATPANLKFTESLGERHQPALSPDRDRLAMYTGLNFVITDTKTGRPVGAGRPSGGFGGRIIRSSGAFNLDGKRLVGVFVTEPLGNQRSVVVVEFDGRAGNSRTKIELSNWQGAIPTRCAWYGDEHILLADNRVQILHVLHLKTGRLVGRFETYQRMGMFGLNRPELPIWFAVISPDNQELTVLGKLDLPPAMLQAGQPALILTPWGLLKN